MVVARSNLTTITGRHFILAIIEGDEISCTNLRLHPTRRSFAGVASALYQPPEKIV
jgi:hypothetical protein